MPEKNNKMPEVYMIFARKIFFPNIGRASAPYPPPSPTPMSSSPFIRYPKAKKYELHERVAWWRNG